MVTDQFPPYPFDIAQARFVEHRAWWAGDMQTLQDIYSGKGGTATHMHNGRAYRGGVMGNLSTMFWGRPVADGETQSKLHLPLPADVAQKSSSLLFGKAVRFELPDFEDKNKQAQARLDTIANSDEMHSALLVAGEYSSVLGGTYLAPVWDAEVAEHVFAKAYRSDVAIPTFRHGHLVSVKLWTEYVVDRDVFRLIEEHKAGLVMFTLHKGTVTNLGPQVSVETLPETEHYANLVSPVERLTLAKDGKHTITIATGQAECAVVYIPNMLPVPDWEPYGALASLGRSDFQGLEPVFDKTDEMWSSLFRDVDLGAGRATVPEGWTKTEGVGQGAMFSSGTQYYVGVPMLGTQGSPEQMVVSQFDIRDDTHLNIIDALERRVLRTIGLSPKEFGKTDPHSDKTATEVQDDRIESRDTRDVKALHARPALAKWARIALAIDGLVFPGKGGAELDAPTVVFPKLSQEDPQKRAQTLQILDAARAISIEAKVRARLEDMDVTETEIKEEIARVEKEYGTAPAPDPSTFKGDDPLVDPAAA